MAITCIQYLRYSSDNQREESLVAQRRACEAYAAARGYTIVRTWSDEARTATTDDRPAFLDMIGEITRGRLRADVLLVHKLDRFARNRYDSAFYRRELRKAGCRLESVLEQLDDSPESVILESILEGMAEYYSKNLSREVMKGMKETALQGKHTGGRPPLGYRIDDERRYQIDEVTAPTIRLIFARYAAGDAYPAIVAQLGQAGHRTATGQPFRENSLHDILINKKYIGTYVFNRTEAKGPDGKRRHRKSKAPTEIIELPDALPALVDRPTWDAVQARMTANRQHAERARHHAKAVYVLSGLLVCGHCGRKMVGSSKSYHTRVGKELRRRHVYQCSDPACPQPELEKGATEAAVVEEMRARLFTPEARQQIARRALEYAKFLKKDRKGEGSHLQAEIRKLESKIGNLVAAIAAGGQLASLVAELQRLEEKHKILLARLQGWELTQRMDPTEQVLLAQLARLTARLDSGTTPDQKALANEFLESVVATDYNLVLNFLIHLNGGNYRWRRAITISFRRQRRRPRR